MRLVAKLSENLDNPFTVLTDKEVYSPSDDSYLLLDCMRVIKGDLVLDVGTGTGIVAIKAALLGASKVVAIDVNPFASRCALKNVISRRLENQISVLTGDLFSLLREQMVFDVVLFNPPYLRTKASEYNEGWLEKSWAGGRNGKVITNRFIDELPDHLTDEGIVFLLQPSTGIGATIKRLRQLKMVSSIVARKKLFFEDLLVLSVMHKNTGKVLKGQCTI